LSRAHAVTDHDHAHLELNILAGAYKAKPPEPIAAAKPKKFY